MASSLHEVGRQWGTMEHLESLVLYSLRNGVSVSLDTESNVREAVSWAKGFLDDSPPESLDLKGNVNKCYE